MSETALPSRTRRRANSLWSKVSLFINTSICWAATPLWYRNPRSAANSGHCALPRTRSLNLTASSVPLLLKPQNSTPQHQIIQTQRTVPYTPDEVYAAFADPSRLAKWWGPKDFINTFETFRVGVVGDLSCMGLTDAITATPACSENLSLERRLLFSMFLHRISRSQCPSCLKKQKQVLKSCGSIASGFGHPSPSSRRLRELRRRPNRV